ncbi:MAG: hypothetical protein WCD60_11585, partial [Pseudolabrys sp.]
THRRGVPPSTSTSCDAPLIVMVKDMVSSPMFQAEDNIPIRKRLIAATHARQQISRMVSYGFSGRKFSSGSDRPSRD